MNSDQWERMIKGLSVSELHELYNNIANDRLNYDKHSYTYHSYMKQQADIQCELKRRDLEPVQLNFLEVV